MHPRSILAAHYNYIGREAQTYNLGAVDEIVLVSTTAGLVFVPADAGGQVAADEATTGQVEVDVDEAAQVEQGGSGPPGLPIQEHVVPLDDDDAVVGLDGDVALDRVLDRVVERGGQDGGGRGGGAAI